MKDIDILRVVRVLNIIFIILMSADSLICFLRGNFVYLYPSLLLLGGLLISRIILISNNSDFATFVTLISFHIVGFYHAFYIGNYITCYFILLVAPLLGIFVYKDNKIKILTTALSCLLFPLCNYTVGIPIFSNYFFYFGLIPSVITLYYFNERIAILTKEKNILINDLKNKNDEIILYTDMMSHDLKAPLRSMNGFAGILKKRINNLNEEDKEILDFIIRGGQSMTHLIDDILLYSKSSLEEYEFEEFNLDALIDSILHSFKYDIENNDVQIEKNNLGKIIANKKTMSLVFQNLISNAMKYQPKEDEHKPKIIINQIKEKDNTIVSVEDNGIGMNKDELKEVFSPFVRLHSSQEYEGTGLGLSIVHKIIEKHNGNINVESKEGKGTKFNIQLKD